MKRSSLAVLCGFLALLDVLGASPAVAQFGFFYGSPQPRRVYRTRRRYPAPKPSGQRPRIPGKPIPGLAPPPQFPLRQPPLQEAPLKQAPPPAAPDVPLPPERPVMPEKAPAAPPPPASVAPKPAPPETIKPVAPPPPPPAAAPPAPSKPVYGPPLPPIPPEKPADLPKPSPSSPPAAGVGPSGAKLGETPRQPEDDATCPSRLKARNVDIEPTTIGPQSDARCTVVQAVRLKGLILPGGDKVDFPEHPTIACATADAFSHFVGDLLSPLAKGTFGAPVSSVWTGPGLECRSMDHIVGAKLSAHGQGLAIDIAQVKLANGRLIEVGQAKNEADQTFETAARNAACGYFHTVLGPGTDSFHRTHWHFDLLVRGAQGDGKYCR